MKLSKLRKLYNAVVIATGCQKARTLGISGEFGNNVFSSQDFINWYNDHPYTVHCVPDLTSNENAIVLGQGNVALDVSRFLLSDPKFLISHSDVSESNLHVLQQSKIRNVICVGRRSLEDVSFTIKEFRDITKMPQVKVSVCSSQQPIEHLPRPRKRLMELCYKHATPNFSFDSLANGVDKNFVVAFQKTPLEIMLNETSLAVEGVKFGQTSNPGSKDEVIPAGLVVKCIGYQGEPCDRSLPFDQKKGVIENDRGKIDTGLYCSGWAKTGPVGVIASTLSSSQETADAILNDLEYLPAVVEPGGIRGYLQKKKMPFVSGHKWIQLYQKEIDLGAELNRPRQKFSTYYDIFDQLNCFH